MTHSRLSLLVCTLFSGTLLTLILAGPALALPVISEIFYDASGSDDGQSFVELYGDPGTVLDGLFLEGVNGSNGAVTVTIPLVGTIPADGIFLLADRDSAGATVVPNADALENFDFQNGPDSVVLRDASSVLDAVAYGVFGPGEFFAGEGASAEDGPAGTSLARFFADVDTDDNALDFGTLDMPTPGVAPLLVPEPTTGALMAAALVASGWLRRRAPRGM